MRLWWSDQLSTDTVIRRQDWGVDAPSGNMIHYSSTNKLKDAMPIIKPISDLRNYPDVLRNVEVGTPVYLTKNGTGRYVLMDIGDFGRMEGAMRLSYELQRGKRSGETQGWISATEMERHFKDRCRV